MSFLGSVISNWMNDSRKQQAHQQALEARRKMGQGMSDAFIGDLSRRGIDMALWGGNENPLTPQQKQRVDRTKHAAMLSQFDPIAALKYYDQQMRPSAFQPKTLSPADKLARDQFEYKKQQDALPKPLTAANFYKGPHGELINYATNQELNPAAAAERRRLALAAKATEDEQHQFQYGQGAKDARSRELAVKERGTPEWQNYLKAKDARTRH